MRLSEISLGCSGFWGNRGFPEAEAKAVVEEALARGVNFFDTGHHYCNYNAEPRLGRILKEILGDSDRSDIIISSKAGTVGWRTRRPCGGRGIQKDFSPGSIERTCAQSIKNLNCEYLDIFQLHGATASDLTAPLLTRLQSMREKGMYRYLGVNTHKEEDMLFISTQPIAIDMVLLDYSILQLDRESVICQLHEAGVGVVAGTVLAQGHLIKGKIGSLKTFADVWYLARALLKHTSRLRARSARGMRDVLASITEMSSCQAAFAFVLENAAVASCVFGTTRVANLREVLDSAGKTLTDASRRSIRSAFDALPYKVSE